jgi:RNA polymerase sigma-B factor
VLTRRQAEKQLILEYRRTGSRRDRDAVIDHFLPLARSLARRYQRGPEPLEDLEQVASLALVRAVEGFDPSRDVAFSSYAVPTITGALKRHYRDHGWSVRVPRELQELAMRIQRFNEAASAATGESPSAAQVARRAGVSVEEVIEAREAYQALHADSLDQPRQSRDDDDDGRASLLDTIGTHDMAFRSAFDRVLLDSLLETLDERDQTIVRLYYLDELTQSEIGRRLGLSQMHISRLLRHATDKLVTTAAEQSDLSVGVAA